MEEHLGQIFLPAKFSQLREYFQQRLHFSPSACLTSILTAYSWEWLSFWSSLQRLISKSEVIQISLKSTDSMIFKIFLSLTLMITKASKLDRILLSCLSSSIAAVTNPRKFLIMSHFFSKSWSNQAKGVFGKSSRWIDFSSLGKRLSQTSSIVNGRIGANQVTSRLKTRSKVYIEAVLIGDFTGSQYNESFRISK